MLGQLTPEEQQKRAAVRAAIKEPVKTTGEAIDCLARIYHAHSGEYEEIERLEQVAKLLLYNEFCL